MKIGDKEFQVLPAPGTHANPPAVVLKVRAWGISVAQEFVTPQQARELARALDAAADAAEGAVL